MARCTVVTLMARTHHLKTLNGKLKRVRVGRTRCHHALAIRPERLVVTYAISVMATVGVVYCWCNTAGRANTITGFATNADPSITCPYLPKDGALIHKHT